MNTTEYQFYLPSDSNLDKSDYYNFLDESYNLFRKHTQYFSGSEGMDVLELAHLLPLVPETILSIYISINDAVCNKGLITPFLPRHSHNNVFVFDPQVYTGNNDVPGGTVDAKTVISGFAPPNPSWDVEWTYLMINQGDRTYESLWKEKGYIDMIPAKFEDFTMLTNLAVSKVCFFIDAEAFNHPVNQNRDYLRKARKVAEKMVSDFNIPADLEGEVDGLVPVVLDKGEKLFVARKDFRPCAHCWSNLHPENQEWAVVNENSAVPLNLVVAKPAVPDKYRQKLVPPSGSADLTTDWFFRASQLERTPIKPGHIGG